MFSAKNWVGGVVWKCCMTSLLGRFKIIIILNQFGSSHKFEESNI